jgi:hypothetical protein
MWLLASVNDNDGLLAISYYLSFLYIAIVFFIGFWVLLAKFHQNTVFIESFIVHMKLAMG